MNVRTFFRDSYAAGAVLFAFAAAPLTSACGSEEKGYEPKGAPSGRAAAVPSPPTLPQKKKKEGDAYTVWGVSHDLRSKVHREEVNDKKISIVGYIVKTNMVACKDDKKAVEEGCVPECAVHKTGKEDGVDCKAPVPAFFIADEKDYKGEEMIQVMGWASNFAKIYDAITDYDKATNLEKQAEVKIEDAVWGTTLPNPLPAVGARVKVTGTYGVTFTKATSGTAANPKYGIMAVDSTEVLEPAPELSNLPGMKERKKKDK